MTRHLKQLLLWVFGIRDLEHPGLVYAQRVRRKILRVDRRLRDEYLRKSAVPKLQIGGGWHRLNGWLNTDIELIPGVLRMDATRRFPFADGTFQYVYTEHMIEHVQFAQGIFLLRECHRVMREGGVIRVTTPDLASIVGLYGSNLSDVQKQYLSWFCQTFLPPDFPPTRANVINAFFRRWGHQFIYDEQSLADALRAAGFDSIERRRLGNSDYEALRNLENEQRYPVSLLDYESVALEGCK